MAKVVRASVIRSLAGILSVLALAGCGSERFAQSGSSTAPATTGSASPVAPRPEMAGRWTLGAAGRGQCIMTFNAAPGAAEGSIAPQGGCPGQFFTSRKWSFDQSGLVIRNHNDETLAQLRTTDNGGFDGKTASGDTVTLTR
jgi:hypothetical protein